MKQALAWAEEMLVLPGKRLSSVEREMVHQELREEIGGGFWSGTNGGGAGLENGSFTEAGASHIQLHRSVSSAMSGFSDFGPLPDFGGPKRLYSCFPKGGKCHRRSHVDLDGDAEDAAAAQQREEQEGVARPALVILLKKPPPARVGPGGDNAIHAV